MSTRLAALRVTSLLSELAEPFYRRTCDYLSTALRRDVEFVAEVPWRDRLEMLCSGEVDASFVCGWHYASTLGGTLQLCAAQVPTGGRYQDRPVYFSDVIVPRDSSFRTLDELRGSRVAYNDGASHSGFNLLLERVRGEQPYFFAAVESGAHTASIRLVSEGAVDCAAIDSTVFDLFRAEEPTVSSMVRVVEVLGPCAAPPLVFGRGSDPGLVSSVASVLCAMHQHRNGQEALKAGLVARFSRVEPGEYSAIGVIGRRVAGQRLAASTP